MQGIGQGTATGKLIDSVELMIREIRICDKHGPWDYLKTKNMWGLEVETYCPECLADVEAEHSLALAVKEQEEQAIEAERERERYAGDMKAKNIEPEYFDASFENFRADTPELANNLAKTKALVSGEVKKLVMTGKNGTALAFGPMEPGPSEPGG